MSKFCRPETFFSLFVVAGATGGVTLAMLEGVPDKNPILEAMQLVSFIAFFPLLMAGVVAERRSHRIQGCQKELNQVHKFVITPLFLFFLGIISMLIGGTGLQLIANDSGSALHLLFSIFISIATPSFFASIIWSIARWAGR